MAAPDHAPIHPERSEGSALRVICGPTAAGKTALALALAEQIPITVISADSRQVYRRFDIGTGKPSREELARVPHQGIDIIEPTERYSAARFTDDATRWLRESAARGREPAIVGGTGFYISALVAPLFEEPELDAGRRIDLQKHLAGIETTELRRWCEALDPSRAHLGRTQLLRAIEIALLTGQRLSVLHARAGRAPGRTARYLLVDPGVALARRIEDRIDAMLRAGWLEEVHGLLHDVPDTAPAWRASGYDAVRAVALGRMTQDQAREHVLIETRQYAKRQRTWFRNQLVDDDVTLLDPTASDAVEQALRWWKG